MPSSKKPRRKHKPFEPKYPTTSHLIAIFTPIFDLYKQIMTGDVDSYRGRPVFKDWTGTYCEASIALDGWAGCWDRVSAGEKITIHMSATRKLARYLKNDVPLTEDDVEASRSEMRACQRALATIPRRSMVGYMQDENIAIEIDRLGLSK